MEKCPCGTGLDFKSCCGPIIKGKPAPTAQDLVRARYTAFSIGNLDFVQETHAPEVYDDFNRAEAERLNESIQWLGLEIINASDETGTVEYRIHLKGPKGNVTRTSISKFRKEEGRWLYINSEILPLNSQVRVKREVGRNDPCLCGSGKKAKKCCGEFKEMTQG